MSSSGGSFSGALRLTDLNDYITPGLECIKPVEKPKTGLNKLVDIEIGKDGNYSQIGVDGEKTKLKEASITLNDCLACSGCITSAESVLISAQSLDEFNRVMESNGESGELHVVMSIAPQARASLALLFGIGQEQLLGRLTTVLKDLGVVRLFDTTFSRDIALMEARQHFVDRFRDQGQSQLPMMESSCPGWICYAEKRYGEPIIPFISTVKSPQQIMGALIKRKYAEMVDVDPSNVYHVSVMPCYDKKLEASRSEFYDEQLRSKEVDCVLTSGEILDLLNQHEIDMENVEESELDTLFSSVEKKEKGEDAMDVEDAGDNYQLYGVEAGSGGWLEEIYMYAAKELFGVDVTREDIEYKYKKRRKRVNMDFVEVTLEIDGEEKLKFARVNGFTNIQKLMNPIKKDPGKAVYHYVEVMACPSGCLNGGGQIKHENRDALEVLKEIEAVYREKVEFRRPDDNQLAVDLVQEWVGGTASEEAKQLFHTEYRAIKDTIGEGNGLTIEW